MTDSKTPPVWAVIPAAGTGSRMGGNTAKQYLHFQGKSILEHSLDRLLAHSEIEGVVVVTAKDDEHWKQLAYHPDKPVLTTDGGKERHDSVYRGLVKLQQHLGDHVIVLVHDAVRPLVSHKDLDAVIGAARNHAAGAILATRVTDTLKMQSDDLTISRTFPRNGLWRALTPQVFPLHVLLDALHRVNEDQLSITDDAQAIEMAGLNPMLVPGSTDNIKITTPADLALAERVWLNQRDQQDNK